MGIGLIVLLGIVLYLLFANNGSSKIQFPSRKSAEEILKERFVNGEIDETTYLKMKETLKN